MLNFKKLISFFLAVLMLCGALNGLSVITASAAENTGSDSDSSGTPGKTAEEKTTYYHTAEYKTPQDKVAAMTKWSSNSRYVIYADEQSGEVAVEDTITGQILFTNPYDIGYYKKDYNNEISANVKNTLMSQIILRYAEIGTGTEHDFTSFTEAAVEDQIKIRNIKNGIRVEYTLGRQEARRLVPRSIEVGRFEELIQTPLEEGIGYTKEQLEADQYDRGNMEAFYLKQSFTYFLLRSLDSASSDALKKDWLAEYPVLSDMDIYVLDKGISNRALEIIENLIKVYCQDYSYEEMDYDHQMTQYTGEEDNPPLFKLALEYTLGENGFEVRLPANGLRFNESMYEVRELKILPYLGAGNNSYDGYVFFPDGGGALLTLEDMKSEPEDSINAKLYGEDYAYHDLELKYEQVTRYPVYGIVENTRFYDYTIYDEELDEQIVTTISGAAYDVIQAAISDSKITLTQELQDIKKIMDNAIDVNERIEKRGFAAVVTEGEALSSLRYAHDGVKSCYDSVALVCNPRPRDEYNLADAISVGNNTAVSVVSERKYVGSYRLQVTMLSDETLAEQAVEEGRLEADDWYESSWLGMAMAYRDYLIDEGYLTELDESSVSEDIPLYIESFGAMETVEKILSIPVEVKRPLTSADNVYTMYKELAAEGVSNINFKLTGYANGGMYSTMPYGLKWEKSVSKETSMQELFNKAYASQNKDDPAAQEYLTEEEKQIDGELTIFPDFDFSYVSVDSMFDGFSMRKHAIRTIDDRYAYKREYMATQQRYAGYFQLAISPAYFDHFYTKLMEEYLAYDNVTAISVGTLGSALNSDFDEDEPYNREDAKGFVTTALEFISNPENNLEVMVDGGNAYTWKYVDHILGVSLDSSRYLISSYSVPFLGVVLHGYMNFTGTPLNMEGDLNYAKLKAIENGASVYFTLSYQNTQNLKEDYYLSKYYSVRYDIWFDDVVEIYNELNSALQDVQTMPIIGHSFLTGTRVPDTDELDRDLKQEYDDTMNFQNNQQAFLEQMDRDQVADARQQISKLGESVKEKIQNAIIYYTGNTGAGTTGVAADYQTGSSSFLTALSNYRIADAEYQEIKALYDSDPETYNQAHTDALKARDNSEKKLKQAISNMAKSIVKIRTAIDEVDALLAAAEEGRQLIASMDCPQNIKDEVELLCAQAQSYAEEAMGMDFIYTSANMELQTFLDIQYLLVIGSLEGEENFSGEDLAGLYEKQYLTIAEKNYGLIQDPATYIMLRYLEANQGMSDAELDAKYSLVDNGNSMDGLLLFIKELMGTDVEFDPAVVAADQVDEEIYSYVQNRYLQKLYTSNVKNLSSATEDATYLKAIPLNLLNISPTKHESTSINNSNIYAVIKKINEQLKTLAGNRKSDNSKLYTTLTGNGSYLLSDLALSNFITEEELEAYVDAVVEVLEKYEYASGKDTYIEYLGDDAARREDARNYINAYYYASVIRFFYVSGNDDGLVLKKADLNLPVLNTKSTSLDSLEILFEYRVATYGIVSDGETSQYEAYVDAYLADLPYVQSIIAEINSQLQPYYGRDLTAELEDHYALLFAEYVLSVEEAPGKLKAEDDKDAPDGTIANSTQLNEDAAALMTEKMPLISDMNDAKALAAEIVALHDAYTLPDGYDPAEAGKAYAYYTYFTYLGTSVVENVTNHAYYYDESVAQMDAFLLGKIEEKKLQIQALLPTDYTTIDYVGAVLQVLADPEDPANAIISEATGMISYAVKDQKRTLEDDVTEYFLYQLLNSMQSAEMGDKNSQNLSIIDGKDIDKEPDEIKVNTSKKNAAISSMEVYLTSNILTNLITQAKAAVEAGEMVNYTLEAFLTAEELQQMVDDAYTYITATAGFTFHPGLTEDEQKAEVKELIKYFFYKQVLTNLNCTRPVDFNLHEIYSGSLEESCTQLKNLVKYFALSYNTNMTEEDFESYFVAKTTDKKDEVDEEESRYVSDDGRIVSVTYGQKQQGGGYTPYKTFILNYNNFSVSVVYEGVTYTIPAYGYVTVFE